MANENGLDSDKSPGFTYKAEFAQERYGFDKRTLMRRMYDNPELWSELIKAGYSPNTKLLSPKIKEIIIKHLG